MSIAVFDVDGTLKKDGEKHKHVSAFFKGYAQAEGWKAMAWSNGGADHAQKWIDKLGLSAECSGCFTKPPTLDHERVAQVLGGLPDVQVDDHADQKIPGVPVFVLVP